MQFSVNFDKLPNRNIYLSIYFTFINFPVCFANSSLKCAFSRDAENLAEQMQGCGLSSRVRREMSNIQNSGENSDFFTNYMTMSGRSKRATRDSEGLFSVRTCSLYMQADHKLYEHIRMKEGNNDPIRTREEIVSLFYNHIKAVNEIYEGTNFNGIKGLHFVIQRTSVSNFELK